MGRTIVRGNYEWDEEKDNLNMRKHGFSFEEILDMFDDPFFYELYDVAHSYEEDRFIGIGLSQGIIIVTTCFMERNGRTRIFSSRPATPKEERLYYGNYENIHT